MVGDGIFAPRGRVIYTAGLRVNYRAIVRDHITAIVNGEVDDWGSPIFMRILKVKTLHSRLLIDRRFAACGRLQRATWHSTRSSSTGKQTGQGRGKSGKDLEVDAVYELLVGEYVVRARDKEEKNFTLTTPLAFRLSTYIITNNIVYKKFIFKSKNDFLI